MRESCDRFLLRAQVPAHSLPSLAALALAAQVLAQSLAQLWLVCSTRKSGRVTLDASLQVAGQQKSPARAHPTQSSEAAPCAALDLLQRPTPSSGWLRRWLQCAQQRATHQAGHLLALAKVTAPERLGPSPSRGLDGGDVFAAPASPGHLVLAWLLAADTASLQQGSIVSTDQHSPKSQC